MMFLRRKLERLIVRVADRLEYLSRRDEDVVLASLLTGDVVAGLNDPVAYASFLRGSLGRRGCQLVEVKRQPAPDSIRESASRFEALTDVLKNLPAIHPATAMRMGLLIDRYKASRVPTGNESWAADVGFRIGRASCPPDKGRVLGAVVRNMRSTHGLELGTAFGVSAMYMLAASPEFTLDTVELNEPQFSISSAELASRYGDRATCHRGSSHEVIPAIGLKERSVDVFFHDAYHSRATYVGDFEIALPYLAAGGVALFDDIRWEDRRFTRGEAAETYAGWRTVVEHPRVLRAIEVDEGLGLALLGE